MPYSNNWPPEPYRYTIPGRTRTMTFISYGYPLRTPSILGLLNMGLEFAENQATIIGNPDASAGRGFYCWDDLPSQAAACIHGRDNQLSWFWFQEVMRALMVLVTRFGGMAVVYSVDDPLEGPIAVGTFEAIERFRIEGLSHV